MLAQNASCDPPDRSYSPMIDAHSLQTLRARMRAQLHRAAPPLEPVAGSLYRTDTAGAYAKHIAGVLLRPAVGRARPGTTGNFLILARRQDPGRRKSTYHHMWPPNPPINHNRHEEEGFATWQTLQHRYVLERADAKHQPHPRVTPPCRDIVQAGKYANAKQAVRDAAYGEYLLRSGSPDPSETSYRAAPPFALTRNLAFGRWASHAECIALIV